jgi:Ca-activated chloride channel family protein
MKKSISILVLMILSAAAFSASVTITGKVTDAKGKPFAGVKVTIKPEQLSSGKQFVITATDGTYRISVNDQAQALVFSFPGFRLIEEKINGRKVINVTLIPENELSNLQETPGSMNRYDKSTRKAIMASPSGVVNERSYQPYNDNFNTEGYSAINETGFRNVKVNPLSTFSIDVDNASYSNIRRFINNGELPPVDAVRIEEMINYFSYDYPEPAGEHPFSVYTELGACPWNTKHQLLLVGLKGKSIDISSLPPANIVFLIDVSGSMNAPNKLPLLKSAFGLLVNELRPQDRVAIVVYAGAAGLVLESTPGNRKDEIMAAIEDLRAGGSTAGGEGLKLAYSEAEKNFIKGGNNRIILATDGDFNVGESSNGGMERLVEEKRQKGVFITVLGFGMGNLKDDKMEIIADKGNGNYSYIDNIQEARKVLVSEFGGTLFTIAKDVKFQVEFNPERVSSYRLIGYENRMLNEEDFNDDKKDAGEMGAGHNVTALYELVPADSGELPDVDPLRYQSSEKNSADRKYSSEYLTIKLRYKLPDEQVSRLFEKQVRNYITDIDDMSENMKFAAAVSEFGMILRNSEFKGSSTLNGAALLAREARGIDEDGYRSEFIRLIKTVKDLGLGETGK